MKEEREKAGLKLNIQKTKIKASSPITSWHRDREKVETVADFMFLGSKITADGDYSHEIKTRLLFGWKAMTNLDSVLKSGDTTLLTRVWFSQSYGSSSSHVWMWQLDHAEGWVSKNWCFRMVVLEKNAFWRCWRRLLRVPWTARRSNQSILKEINPKYSLEGLMLKLKLQYFGHLMWRADSLEKNLMLGKIDGRRRRGWQMMR